MQKNSRQWTALVLTVLMLLTMLPAAPASAEDPYWCCPVCGSHDGFDPGRYIPPTCTQSGALSGYCGNCYDNNPDDETYGYVEGLVPALGHEWEDWWCDDGSEPTCTQPGTECSYCNRCGEPNYREVPALGHDWGEWWHQDDEEPTCTEKGKEHRYCNRCDLLESRDIPALGHDWGEWNITKSPTCTEDGYREHTCNRCGIKEGESVPARGHAFGDWVVTRQPTCTEEGEKQSKCSRCGKTLTEPIPALGHKYGEWTVDRQPTCVQEGLKHTTCGRCGDIVYDNIPTVAHTWGNWHVIQEPTDFACGYEQRECQVCGKEEKRPIYPDGAIKNGDRGDDVKKLQEELNKGGYDCGKADGIAGNKTTEAIEKWQLEHGYTSDGVWYPGYWNVDNTPVGPTPVPAQPKSSLLLEVLSVDKTTAAYGDEIHAKLKLTNTGDIYLTVNGLRYTYDDDQFAGDDSMTEDTAASNGKWSLFAPGEYLIYDYTIKTGDKDEALGYIRRNMVIYAKEWLNKDDKTPVTKNNKNGSGFVTDDSLPIVESNTVQIDVDTTVPVDLYSSLLLEVVSVDKTAIQYGETVEVVLKGTNMGTDILTVWGYTDAYEDGAYPFKDQFAEQEGWSFLEPDESFLTIMTIQSDITDRDYGYVYRRVSEVGNEWLYEDDLTPVIPGSLRPGNMVTDHGSDIYSNEVEIRVELLNDADIPALDISGSYNEYINYGYGDQIHFDIELTNIGGTDLKDFDVDYDVGSSEVVYHSGGWGVASPDVAPGESVETGMLYTVKQEDVERGYVCVDFKGYAVTLDGQTKVSTKWLSFKIPVRDICPQPEPLPPDGHDPIDEPDYKLVLAIDEISPLTSEYYNGNKVTFRWTVMNLSNVDVSFGGIVRYPDPSDAAYGSGSMQSFVGQDPSVILTANGGDVSGETYIYLNKAEAIDDVIHSIFEAYGCEAGTGVNVCASNRVELTNKLAGGTPPWVIPATTSVEVKKAFATAPKNVNGFTEGEEITYEITVTNTCTETITDIEVSDPLKGSNEDAIVGTILSLDPGCSETVSFVYTVTYDDIVNGYIKNIAEASWIDGDSGSRVIEKSNQVIVPTTDEISETADLSIIKTVAGDPPKNGKFFVEGEMVTFGLTVTNNTPYPFDNVIISDILESGSDKTITTLPILDPNDSQYFEYTYFVTGLDAQMGYITNTAAAVGTDYEGYKHLAISNDVSVNTGIEKNIEENGTSTETGSKDPFGVITDLEIIKTEISKPANGSFYQVGEVIRYTITVKNVGESTIDEVLIYDTLREPIGSEMASIELFYPDSVRSYTFEYTVTDEDVANGYVVNYATAIYYMGSYADFRIAGPVISDTDGNPDTFTGEEKKFDKEIKLGGDEGEYVPCMRILDAKGNVESDYTLHTCTIHQPAEDKVAALVSAAKTDAEKAEAWKQAQAIWTEEIDKIYDACFEAAANVTSLTAVINDKAMFYAQLNVWKASLELIYADQPAVVEEKVAEALMNKCHDFCCEVHTAPEARADSLLHEHALLADAEPAATCERTILAKEGSDVRYAEKLCEEHAAIMQMIDQKLAECGNKYEDVWDSAVNMWIGELNNDTNMRYRDADADGRSIIAADRMTFDSYLKAHDAIIGMFYPEDYSIRAEVYFKTVMNRVVDYCTTK